MFRYYGTFKPKTVAIFRVSDGRPDDLPSNIVGIGYGTPCLKLSLFSHVRHWEVWGRNRCYSSKFPTFILSKRPEGQGVAAVAVLVYALTRGG